jgi:hypothetical protein
MPLKVLVLALPWNPTCRNWVYGLSKLGYSVASLVWNSTPLTLKQLEDWGFAANEIPIFQMANELSPEISRSIVDSLNGTPDIIFSWEGALILKPLQWVEQTFPTAKVIHCVNTFPNAVNALSELRMYWRYRRADTSIDGYVFYSKSMQAFFQQKIPTAQKKPYLVLVEPFLKVAFADPNSYKPDVPELKRIDDKPYIIFTGRGTELWNSFSLKERRDALGSFFQQLSQQGIRIFLPPKADLRGLPNLHHYPVFSNQDIYSGRFAEYISQFDAHLVMYNEWNGTMRRWVSTGLSTRFAYALTATSPLAVSQTSQFIHELWHQNPFGFVFHNIDDLAISLHDRQALVKLRQNMEQVHRSYSFESQSSQISGFFETIATKASTSFC